MRNYGVTKSICIPSGTGSGMVIPVSPLRCWKTEGLWSLFLLFLPSLCYSKLSWHSSHPHPPEFGRDWWHPWAVQEEKREWECVKVERQENEVVVKRLLHFYEINGLTKPVELWCWWEKWGTQRDDQQLIQFLTLYLVPYGDRLILQLAPLTTKGSTRVC